MEYIDLTTPDQTSTGTPKYHVNRLVLDWVNAVISIQVLEGAFVRQFDYTGATATTFMRVLNTSNLSVKSLHKRILERLIADGKLAGTISGTPDS